MIIRRDLYIGADGRSKTAPAGYFETIAADTDYIYKTGRDGVFYRIRATEFKKPTIQRKLRRGK